MALNPCTKCGAKISDSADICPKCGAILAPSFNCPDCGQLILSTVKDCPHCGCPINKIPTAKSDVDSNIPNSKEEPTLVWVFVVLAIIGICTYFYITIWLDNKNSESIPVEDVVYDTATETSTESTYNDQSEFESQPIEEEPIIEDTYDWIYKDGGWVGTIYGRALGFKFFDNGEVYAQDDSGDYMYRYSIDKDNNRIKVLLYTGETLFLDLEPRERAIYINGTRLH